MEVWNNEEMWELCDYERYKLKVWYAVARKLTFAIVENI